MTGTINQLWAIANLLTLFKGTLVKKKLEQIRKKRDTVKTKYVVLLHVIN